MIGALALLLSAASLSSPSSGFATNRNPAWSPDGNSIAFTNYDGGQPEIWMTDGSHVRRLVRNGEEAAWSPEGSRIVFTGAGEQLEVVQVAAGNQAPRPVRSGELAHDGEAEASWSPDGAWIAYSRFPECFGGWTISRISADGKQVQELVSAELTGVQHYTPAWSPDGTRIAYTSTDGGIDVLSFAAQDVVRITKRKIGTWHPSWSPDGRRIVFAETSFGPNGEHGKWYGRIWVLEVATGRMKRLTRMLGDAPAWSPGGKRIAFAAEAADGSHQIFLVNPDGSHLKQLTTRRRRTAARRAG